jgi:phosphate ABC transporter permease protein PstC
MLFHNIKIINIELVWIDFFVSFATFLAFMRLFDVGLLFKNIFRFATFFCIFVLLVMVAYLFASGIPAIFKIGIFNFLFGTEWFPTRNEFGILPFILCSIVVTLGAVIVGVPIGVLTSVFLSEFCHPKLSKIVNVFIKLLAGIPSVVFGFFGMLAVIPIVRKVFYDNTTGDCLLTAIIILSMMILPTIISISESSVKIMSERYLEASLALGESKARSIFKVVIPAAKKGILSGVFLGLGKAIGETMAVIMVSGNAVNFPNLLKSSRFLTTAMALEFSYAAGLHREALFSIGLVLFIMIFFMNMIFVKILKKD